MILILISYIQWDFDEYVFPPCIFTSQLSKLSIASTDIRLGAIQLTICTKANPFHTFDSEGSHVRTTQIHLGLTWETP